jgi:hypothetical protein
LDSLAPGLFRLVARFPSEQENSRSDPANHGTRP